MFGNMYFFCLCSIVCVCDFPLLDFISLLLTPVTTCDIDELT